MHEDWQNFLRQQSANILDGLVTDFERPQTETEALDEANSLADLSQFDVLTISGQDSADFLHAQFTSDVSALGVNELQQSSWCNIKGRVIASFLLYRSQNGYYLLLKRDMTELILKRLSMFVLRSRVSIENKSNELIRIGIRGDNSHQLYQQFLESNSEASTITLLSIKGAVPRSIVLCAPDLAKVLWQKLAEQSIAVGSSHWSLFDIRAGIAWVGESGSEEFLPQSLNLDLTGGLSFSKGCYPGQEIIARMHFRGKLKQRLFLAQVSVKEKPAAKTRLYVPGLNQHVGMMVNSVVQENDNCLMLVVLDLESKNSEIHLESADGAKINILSLPYSLNP
jgi:folate-binding protein YgfZ